MSGHVLIDAVMNTQAMSRCLRDFDYKVWVIELVIEYAEQVLDVKLSRQFDIPTAIAVKGGMPEPIRLRLPTEVFVSKMIKEINKKKEWQLKPSIQKRGDEMVVLIDMPDEVKSERESDTLLLMMCI